MSCNWLLWRQAADEGWHIVFYESYLDPIDRDLLSHSHYIRAADWMYVDGRDITLFEGVSLGRKLILHISRIILEWNRLSNSLENLVVRFQPEKLLFFDFQAELPGMDAQGRWSVVLDVAQRHNLTAIDQRELAKSDNDSLPNKQFLILNARPKPTMKMRVKASVSKGLGLVLSSVSTVLGVFHRRRRKVLLMCMHKTTLPLLSRLDKKYPRAMMPARLFPNKRHIGFLFRSLLKGVYLLELALPKLDADDRNALDVVRADVSEALARADILLGGAIAKHVRDIFNTDWPEQTAQTIKWANTLLDRCRPDAILVDGLLNSDYNIVIESARRRNIKVAGTWHSIIMTDTAFPIFGTDSRLPPLVDRAFSWGAMNEAWLKNTKVHCDFARTGSLISSRSKSVINAPFKTGKNVLILQLAVPGGDITGRAASEYAAFADIAVALLREGYQNVRLKLHPGFPRDDYYKRIVEHYGFKCAVVREGSIEEQVGWADIVIGPACSGGMLETVATGTPYYPFVALPTDINPEYLDGIPFFSDVDTLVTAVRHGRYPDQQYLMDWFLDQGNLNAPEDRVWEELNNLCTLNAGDSTSIEGSLSQSQQRNR